MDVPILQGVYADPEAAFKTSYPINLEPNLQESGLSKGYLTNAPGVRPIGTGPGADRGSINWNGVCYRVMGSKLVSVADDAELGALLPRTDELADEDFVTVPAGFGLLKHALDRRDLAGQMPELPLGDVLVALHQPQAAGRERVHQVIEIADFIGRVHAPDDNRRRKPAPHGTA